jgi:chemotaxis protein MotB
MKKDAQGSVVVLVEKRGRAHPAAHGGAWKVAFADFMTAMFALFLVLWLTNQTSDVKAAIAGYFQDPLGRASESGSSIVPGQGAPAAAKEQLSPQDEVTDLKRKGLENLARRLENRFQLTPELKTVRQHIELLEDSTGFFFESGAARPSGRGAEILALLGSELGRLPLPVRIEGHTDAYQFHSREGYTNWELSADRANAARRILTESGLAPEQVAQVAALADRDPRLEEDRYSPFNRRVTITMLLRGPGTGIEPATPRLPATSE